MGQLWLVAVSTVLLLFTNVIHASVIPRPNSLSLTKNLKNSKEVNYRLDSTVIPNDYVIEIKPNFKDFTFEGNVQITVDVMKETNTIKLHYAQMNISSFTLQKINESDNTTTPIDTKDIDNGYDIETNIYQRQTADSNKLEKGKYYIIIEYIGYMKDDMAGFYRSSYTENNETRWLAATQFEPTDARRAYPGFDEPALKATFQVNVIRSSNMKTISNTPCTPTKLSDDDQYKDVCQRTEKMSTYLVAFIVSEFKELSTSDNVRPYSVWVRENALEQASYSVRITPSIINFMESFTGIAYKLSKLDEAALPDFSAGAMENWGLVTYRERLILFSEDSATTSTKQGVATTIAHELSHQWFGDLVSPDWWNFLWLNEGFATYFEYHATATIEPTWRLKEQFVVDYHQTALAVDSLEATHPITPTVNSPAEINSIFDDITYNKAGSIIRTAEHFLTHDTFMKGLQNYLTQNQFSTGTPDKLFTALRDQQTHDNITTDMDAIDILKGWTEQPGYPLINVTRTDNGIHIKQQRFLITGKTADPPIKWSVPISYTTQNKLDFDNTKPNVWLTNKEDEKDIPVPDDFGKDQWIILNIQETGFYRVLYDTDNYKLIKNYLLSDQYTKIHPINRAQILDDSLNLARAGLLDYAIALDLTTYLAKETDYIPWTSYFKAISFLDARLAGSAVHDKFKYYVSELVTKLYNNIGFNMLEQEEHTQKLNRVNALKWACQYQNEDCVKSATPLFDSWIKTNGGINTIVPDLRSVVYCTAIQNGNKTTWDFLWQQYQNTDVSTEQVLILQALGCTTNEELLDGYLTKTITDGSGIRMQDSASVFASVCRTSDGAGVALKFLNDKFEAIKEYYTAMNAVGSIIGTIASSLSTQEQLDKLQAFVDGNKDNLGSAEDAAKAALETVQSNIDWVKNNQGAIDTWLPEVPTTTEQTTTTTEQPGAANSLSIHPIIVVFSIIGYLTTRY